MSDRILSIQSHVAFGYVGGKAAVFPLQSLGFDVDVINTVNFSNHSGYGRFGGSKASADELIRIVDIMEANGLLSPSRLLTGYIPGAEALAVVAGLAKKLKSAKPDLIYLLDPVLGDAGKLYVAPEVVPIYRELLPQATIITPNWFEVETLANIRLSDAKSLRTALKILHEEYHVPHVVMSSMPLQDFLAMDLPLSVRPTPANNSDNSIEDASNYLVCVSSSYIPDPNQRRTSASLSTVHTHCHRSIPGYFSGVGDLFSALVLAHFDPPHSLTSPTTLKNTAPADTILSSPAELQTQLQTSLSIATSHALSKTVAILSLTHSLASELPESERTLTDDEKDASDPERKVRRMRGRELRIVQGQDIIRGTKLIEFREMQLWENFWAADTTTTP